MMLGTRPMAASSDPSRPKPGRIRRLRLRRLPEIVNQLHWATSVAPQSVPARPAVLGGGVLVVTGAASGIGRSIALRLATEGVKLALIDIDSAALAAVGRLCAERLAATHAYSADVTDAERMRSVAAQIREDCGPISMLANCAGIIHTGSLLDSDLADMHRVFDVNYWGIVHCCKAFLPHLLDCDEAYLVNLSSAFGLITTSGYSAYSGTKFALRALTESLQQETRQAASRVTIACAYPGGVRTNIMRNGSYAVTEDREKAETLFDTQIARTDPDDAAGSILRALESGKTRILVGPDARLADLLARVTGTGYQRLVDMQRRRGR
jgi:short-subunit dehydrogenase